MVVYLTKRAVKLSGLGQLPVRQSVYSIGFLTEQ